MDRVRARRAHHVPGLEAPRLAQGRGPRAERTGRAPTGWSNVPLRAYPPAARAVALTGVRAPLLFPGQADEQTFRRWLDALEQSRAFADDPVALRVLRALEVQEVPLACDARPRVGLLVSDPRILAFDDSHSARALTQRLEALGCQVVLLPPRLDLLLPRDRGARREALAALVGGLDGLVGPGGADVDPRLYGQLNRFSVHTNLARDRAEAELVLAAMQAELFMLGVCRSHQLWNAALGGALVQDVEREGYSSVGQNQEEHGLSLSEPFVLKDAAGEVLFENRVHLAPSSELARLVGDRQLVTNSFHHQAVKRPGQGLRVVGQVVDPKTGRPTIEATECDRAITVQWHPELAGLGSAGDARLLAAFARRALVFRWWKELREGEPDLALEPRRARLLERMQQQERRFVAADFDWVRRLPLA